MKPIKIALLLMTAAPALADVVVPTRTIRPHSLIMPEDVTVKPVTVSGAIGDPAQVIGMEARVALYPGRPMQPEDVRPPALVERNAIVTLRFSQGGLVIATEGRALGRAAVGETVRVMNLGSRNTVSGRVMDDGSVEVR